MATKKVNSLEVLLTDKVSGPAGKIANALQSLMGKIRGFGSTKSGNLDALAKSLGNTANAAANASQKLTAWSASFQNKIEKLRLSSRQFAEVEASWKKLNATLDANPLGKNKAFRTTEINRWRNATLADLAKVRQGFVNTTSSAKALSDALRGMAPIGIAGGAGYMTGRATGAAVRSAATLESERLSGKQAGFSDADVARLQATAVEMSAKYRSVGAADIMRMLRLGAPNFGGLAGAEAMAPTLVPTISALQQAKGVAMGDDDLEKLIKGIDVLGRSMDPDATKRILSGLVQAAQVDPAAVTGEGFLQFAKYSRGAGKALSPEALVRLFPFFANQIGGMQAGTQVASAMQNFLVGRGTKSSQAYQMRLGLKSKDGRLVDERLYSTDPDIWVQKYVVPALQREGILPKDMSGGVPESERGPLIKALSDMASNRQGTDLIAAFIADYAQIQKIQQANQQAVGLTGAEDLSGKDPFMAFAAVMAQLNNFAAIAGGPLMEPLARGLNAIAGGIASLSASVATFLAQNPSLAPWAAGAGGAAVAGGLGYLAYKGIGGMLSALSGGGSAAAGGLAAVFTALGKLGPLLKLLGVGSAGFELGGILKNRVDQDVAARRARTSSLQNERPPQYRGKTFSPITIDVSEQKAIAEARSAMAQIQAIIDYPLVMTPILNAGGLLAAAQAAYANVRNVFAQPIYATVRAAGSAVGGAVAGSTPNRASGGPVSAGRLYRVNEGGRDEFAATTHIHPMKSLAQFLQPAVAGKGKGGNRVSVSVGGIHVTGAGDPDAVASAVVRRLDRQLRSTLAGYLGDVEMA